jgi:hypothetical protein
MIRYIIFYSFLKFLLLEIVVSSALEIVLPAAQRIKKKDHFEGLFIFSRTSYSHLIKLMKFTFSSSEFLKVYEVLIIHEQFIADIDEQLLK